MSVVRVKIKNFKKITELDINPDGESFFVVGDFKEGKSTLLQAIKSVYLQAVFPSEPLTEGAEEGFIEVVERDVTGKEYTFIRKFNKKSSGRFEVRAADNGKYTLTDVLSSILGPSFKNKYFDYEGYFYKCLSPESRYKYMVDAIGGDKIIENKLKRKKLVVERGQVGTDRKHHGAVVLENGSLDPSTIEADIELYAEKKLPQLAIDARQKYIDEKSVDFKSLTEQIKLAEQVVETKKNISEKITESALKVAGNKLEIERLKAIIADLEATNKYTELQIKKDTKVLKGMDVDAEDVLEKLILESSEAAQTNHEVTIAADKIWLDTMHEIDDFNEKRTRFIAAMNSYKEFNRLDKEWNDLDKEIQDIDKESSDVFKKNLPIPELSISENDNNEGVVLYNGREFSLDNLSTGESILISAQIQRALNPDKTSLIVIPRGQDLGSGIDEVMSMCKEFNIQCIVEITKRDEKFKVIITDDAKSI